MEPLADAIRQSRERPVRFAAVFDDQFRPLISYLAPRVYDHEIAVDLASETIATAFHQRHRFRGSTDREVVAWLNAIATKKLARFFRKAKVEDRALRKLGITAPKLTDEDLSELIELGGETHFQAALRGQLRRLPSEQREALELRVVQERSYRSISQQLGITEEATRARVARALKNLRRSLHNQYAKEMS